jgi:hypothetical protein
MFIVPKVLHNLADAASAYQCNRVFSVKLGVIPVHFGQVQDFVADIIGRFVRLCDSTWNSGTFPVYVS